MDCAVVGAQRRAVLEGQSSKAVSAANVGETGEGQNELSRSLEHANVKG